jgi:hypothetical protein
MRAFLGADVNLARAVPGAANAASTIDKVIESVARFLGYLINIEGRPGPATMEWLLDGAAILRFTAWATYIRCACATTQS